MGGGITGSNDCLFKRGICTQHKIKGKKTIVSSKKWTKKKFGFGWVTSKKTEFTCPGGVGLPEQPKHNPTDVMLSESPEQRVERGSEVLNFVLLGSEDDQTREVVKNGRSDTWLGD